MLASPTNFLDNLKNLVVVMSVALEHVQGNRDQFAKSATGVHARQAEKSISVVRDLTVQLDKEFTILEYLIEGRPNYPKNNSHSQDKKPRTASLSPQAPNLKLCSQSGSKGNHGTAGRRHRTRFP
jgi:hypothetical protein